MKSVLIFIKEDSQELIMRKLLLDIMKKLVTTTYELKS